MASGLSLNPPPCPAHAQKNYNRRLKERDGGNVTIDEPGIVATTDGWGISSVTDRPCTVSKYSREEFLAQEDRLIDSSYHSKECIRDRWTTIQARTVWHGEIKNKAEDGSFSCVDTTMVPILDEQGNLPRDVRLSLRAPPVRHRSRARRFGKHVTLVQNEVLVS